MKTKKLLSILLALMMMLSVVPMYASAATQIALKATHVTEWPTAEGEIYYGEPLSKIKLIGGEVQYNGTVVPGHFEHVDPTVSAEEAMDAYEADIKFIPDDASSYKGFTKLYSKTTFKVHKTTPILADETKPPVATAIVEPGVALSSIAISDGAMINPYDNSESSVKKVTWKWSAPETIVYESGYYEAKFVASTVKYVTVKQNIYVEVNAPISIPTIAEYPTIPELTYNPDVTWADIELTGGKAVIKGTETEVEGTFAIKETRLNVAPNPNFTEIEVVFTPADPEAALPYEFTIPVKVNPAHISFVDGEGNAVVEGFEFEVEPGTKMGDVRALLNAVLRIPANSVTSVEDSNSYAQNGRTYKLTVLYDENSNYTGKELYFTVKFKNVELTPTFGPGYLKSSIRCGDYSPKGTFTVSLNGKEIAVVKANEEFTYTVENSGDHIFSAKYNPAENDYFIINDFETTVNVKLKRLLTCVNTVSDGNNTYYPGDKVEISANLTAENFAGWKVTDKAGNEVTVEGVDNTNRIITITMPDYDITVEALEKNATSSGSGGLGDIDLGDLSEGDSEWAIINIIRNIIAMFKSFLQQLIETFQSIGG
ncbi:MAG: hypothetical protein IKL10_11330 [Clostridia bacterium]|nr:hypothetical protein [Clostridia bacterium]